MTLRPLRGATCSLLLLLLLALAARADPPPPPPPAPAGAAGAAGAESGEREELAPGPEPRRQPPPDETADLHEGGGGGNAAPPQPQAPAPAAAQGGAPPSAPPAAPPAPPPQQPPPAAAAAAAPAAETVPVGNPDGGAPAPRAGPAPQGGSAPPAGAPAARITDWEYGTYDCLTQRDAPPTHRTGQGGTPYVISEQRLRQIRAEFLYCFFDRGGDDGEGDYQKNVHASTPQVHKNFNFQLPFFGFRFNYTRVSLNGYLEFSDPPEHYTYPLVFPNKDWPTKNDPSFIGIFFSKMRVGKLRPDDVDQRHPGVYFRLERDLQTRIDQFGVEMRERLMWDIREGVVGADTFEPKHAVFVTWKNVSFAGGIDNALYRTNTFQLVLATDEVYTYAIFNYVDLQWTSHTEAGGDTTIGEGGVPAYVGFNAGNGTRSYQYMPYSQASTLRDLTGRGWGNGFPGRHIFRIDERIMLGNCNKDIAGTDLELVFAPESGNMLGGTVVNITGPCFDEDMKIRCKFDKMDVWGTVVDRNRAICIQPFVYAEGYVPLEVSTGGGFNWKGKYFIETPATATERISFSNNDVHLKSPNQITIKWDRFNLTSNGNAPVRISLWGYREPKTTMPHLVYIDTLEESISNQGVYTIHPGNYRTRDNSGTNDIQFGFIHINLTNPDQYHGLTISPVLWSKPIPLAWYFGPQWERKYGTRWPVQMCNNWIKNDRYLKNFAAEVPQCPCILDHVLNDKGRYLSDWECDMDINPDCYYHQTAVHCMRTGAPSHEGLEQLCCYDKNGYLMLSYDQMWGSRPFRSHNFGFLPWNEATKVPTLSQWYHDYIPFYQCCMWQSEQAVGCETFRFERRPTQDCIAYQAPSIAAVFGDPHIVTFDNLEYTFNGKGEFVLVHADSNKAQLDVQARFEQVPRNIYGEVAATQLTAVATKDNISATIEIRVRPEHARWRYHLDVFADGRRVYFDRDSLKTQHFRGVIVYTPSYILNQSEVIVMFQSGAGVEVVENKGYLSCRVYLPWSFINQTRGLFGNWSFDMTDDFTLPNGYVVNLGSNMNNFERVHRDFAIEWMLEDKENDDIGKALFTRENMRSSNYYGNRSFVPEYRKSIYEIIPTNRSSRNKDIEDAENFCGDSYQCQFDYALTLNREMAQFTKFYQDQFTNMKADNEKNVVSCGVLETPRFGRKSNFYFTPGAKVTFECDENFILTGDKRRTCNANGQWDLPEYGYTECLRHQEYSSRQIGIISGIILGILVPILFIIVLTYCWLKRKKEVAHEPASSWKYDWQVSGSPTGTKQRNLSDEGESLKKLSTSTASSLSPEKKPKHYDGVYYTNEPLPGKPPVDFEEKVWDLDDEITPSATTSFAEPSESSEPSSVLKSRQTDIY